MWLHLCRNLPITPRVKVTEYPGGPRDVPIHRGICQVVFVAVAIGILCWAKCLVRGKVARWQNLIPPWHNPRKGRDQILPSGNLASDQTFCSTDYSNNSNEDYLADPVVERYISRAAGVLGNFDAGRDRKIATQVKPHYRNVDGDIGGFLGVFG